MGTGAGKRQGRAEGGGEGGIRDTHICKGGGGGGGLGGGSIWGGVLKQSLPLTPRRAVKGRA